MIRRLHQRNEKYITILIATPFNFDVIEWYYGMYGILWVILGFSKTLNKIIAHDFGTS